MSFAAPGWIALAALASLAIVAIHLISWRLPRTVVLPTARFVPDEPARRAARTIRLADLWLLALRVGVVMLGGAAMARPVFETRPGGAATVIAVAAARDSSARMDGIRRIPRADHVSFVAFDTSARVVSEASAIRTSESRAFSLSAGVLAAVREGRRLQQDYDSVRIALVSPLTGSAFDNATRQIRALWPDSIQVVRIPFPRSVPEAARTEFVASGDDPVVAGIRLAQSNGLVRGNSRVIREGGASLPDSGQAIVLWPQAEPNDSVRVDAVWAGGVTAIGQYTSIPLGDSGRVIARWSNGTPAAREFSRGAGCVRAIGFDVPDVGDFVLTPSFQRLAAELLAPCDAPIDGEPAPDSLVAMLSAPSTAVPIRGLSHDPRNRTAAIIMALAVLLGLAELLVRRNSAPVVMEQRA